MIDLILSLIPGGGITAWLAAGVAAVLGALGFYFKARASGAASVNAKQADAGLKATVKGNEAARQGKAEAAQKLRDGETPEEIVRNNDGKW